MNSQQTSMSLLDRLTDQPSETDWQRLTTVYSPMLHQWLRKYQIQQADADDLVQDVLATLQRKVGDFQHNERQGAFRNWLRRILINRLRDHWRANKRRPQVASFLDGEQQLGELADDESSLTKIWDEQHDRHVMQQLMKIIRPRFEENTWQAFELQMLEGLSATEVAEKLAVSKDVVYASKSRVLQALRQEARGLVE